MDNGFLNDNNLNEILNALSKYGAKVVFKDLRERAEILKISGIQGADEMFMSAYEFVLGKIRDKDFNQGDEAYSNLCLISSMFRVIAHKVHKNMAIKEDSHNDKFLELVSVNEDIMGFDWSK